MRGLLLGCLFAGVCLVESVSAQERLKGPADEVAPKTMEKSPFWIGKPLRFGKLKKAEVRLLEKPNEEIDFAVVQVGDTNPVNYLDDGKPSNVTAYVEKAEIPYAIAEEGLKAGSKVYRDRKYVIVEMPEAIAGLTYLQTRAAHKAIVDARYSIVLSVEKPTWVFLAIDERAFSHYTSIGAPGWLKEYSPTEFRIVTDDPIMAGQSGYRIFAKKIGPGKVVLGSPALEVRRNSMYFAFFGEEE